MSGLFRYTGAAFIMICAFLISRGYSRYLRRGEREREGFLSLIDHFRHKIDCYLSTPTEAVSDFESEPISTLLQRVREGESPENVFREMKGSFAIGKEGCLIIERLFSDLSRGYKDTVIGALDSAREALGRYCSERSAEDEKSARLAAAMLFGFGLGLVILLI